MSYDWIKPADNYDDLLKQFKSLKMLLIARDRERMYYLKNWYSPDQVESLQKLLDEERSINEHLTNELERGKIV